MEAVSFQAVGYAVLLGIVPPLIWLYFLLQENTRCPEPRALIFIAFLLGMIAVPIVIPLESVSLSYVTSHFSGCSGSTSTCTPAIFAWAAIEETVKYTLAAIFLLRHRAVDNSLDLVIYMVTVALGFAALENVFFLVTPFAHGDITNGLITDNLRFVGSTLLHVVASSAIGFALAFSHAQPRPIRALAAAGGLILAIALHSVFNFFIITQNGSQTIIAFFFVWTGAVLFLALFEILKYFRFRNLPANTC
jgi:RsiW-degrading membrane proteinase PrsW (M82 family)